MVLDPRRHAFRPDLADMRLQGKVDAHHFVSGKARRIITPLVSVHSQPKPESGINTQALLGESVLVFEENNSWAWIQKLNDGYVGYVEASHLGAHMETLTHRVTALRTFIYPGPNLKLPTTRYLSLGGQVRVINQQGDYAEIAGGGFVYFPHLHETEHCQSDFVSVAESLIGTPYLWGGKSSLGIDCSGLVQLSLSETGVACPRDSDMQQAELGDQLDITPELIGLQRGDLVFWKGHVAIMLDAHNIIHANGWSMSVISEPLAVAANRTEERGGGPITAIRRL